MFLIQARAAEVSGWARGESCQESKRLMDGIGIDRLGDEDVVAI